MFYLQGFTSNPLLNIAKRGVPVFGIRRTELVLILIFAFIIFGPDKLPAIGRTIGRVMRQFKNAQDEMNKVVKTEIYDPLNDNEPLKNPFDSSNGAKKKSNSAAAAGKEETFAERKARMTREKEAARAAKAQAEAAKVVPAKPSSPQTANDLYGAVTNPSATSSDAAKAAAATAAAAQAAHAGKDAATSASTQDAGKDGGKDA